MPYYYAVEFHFREGGGEAWKGYERLGVDEVYLQGIMTESQ